MYPHLSQIEGHQFPTVDTVPVASTSLPIVGDKASELKHAWTAADGSRLV